MRLLARRTFRTGVQSLWITDDGRYRVHLKNRTNDTMIPIPREKVDVWLQRLLRT